MLALGQFTAEPYLPYELSIDINKISETDTALIGRENPFDKAPKQIRTEFVSPADDTVAANALYSEDFAQFLRKLLQTCNWHKQFCGSFCRRANGLNSSAEAFASLQLA